MATRKVKEPSYLYNDQAVAQLARQYVEGVEKSVSVGESYLKVLVAHSQEQLKSAPGAATQDAMLGAVTAAHARLYGIILQAVASEADAKERNRRTNFARTSKADITSWLRAGYKLSTLNPATVSKDQLRKQTVARRSPPTFAQQLEAARARVVTLLKELAEQDAEAAREQSIVIQQVLRQEFEPVKQLTRRTRKVGEMVLHPH